jgi:deoxyribodipyrimidine photo-lyase
MAMHCAQRPFVYTQDELERGETHDDLWNAAQLQMVREGKMHGCDSYSWMK